jgi:Homeodomain-like domain
LIHGGERASPTIGESDSVFPAVPIRRPEQPEGDFAMAGGEIAVKKYVVKLSEAERDYLQTLLNKGKSPAKRLLKARILLKADASEHGEGWSDGRIVEALDTNMSMVTRVRQQLVEEGLEAVLSRKQRETPARTPIFDGEKQARLTALACSTPPEGYARWTLRLLENKVVELGIVKGASDSTIGRVLKKTRFSLTAKNSGSSRRRPAAAS